MRFILGEKEAVARWSTLQRARMRSLSLGVLRKVAASWHVLLYPKGCSSILVFYNDSN